MPSNAVSTDNLPILNILIQKRVGSTRFFSVNNIIIYQETLIHRKYDVVKVKFDGIDHSITNKQFVAFWGITATFS